MSCPLISVRSAEYMTRCYIPLQVHVCVCICIWEEPVPLSQFYYLIINDNIYIKCDEQYCV